MVYVTFTEKLRPLWKSYTRCTDGIIFVVDSVDAERMEEAKTELHKIAKTSENQGVPLLVVANKQDLRHSLGLAEIEKLLASERTGPCNSLASAANLCHHRRRTQGGPGKTP
uniref:ADP-ribosylation factor-like 4aa n=1 Tax=Lates calcarifer TaxID=8187 RepID=A0A4W6CPJ3_LATCA